MKSEVRESNRLIKLYQKNYPLSKPTNITLILTRNCNLKCIMCDVRENTKKSEEDLSFNDITNIIEQMSFESIKSLTLSGGEPLLRKDCIDLIKYASLKGIDTTINTNATIINKEISRKIIKAGLKRAIISLDGEKAQTHDLIRGVKGTFEKVIGAVSYLKDYVDLTANTVVMEENFSELLGILLLSRRIGIKTNTFQPRLDSLLNFKLYDKKVPNGKIDILERQIDKINKYREKIKGILTSEYEFSQIINYFKNKRLIKPQHCLVGYKQLYIFVDGSAFSCSIGGNMGNIKEQKILEIWKSKNACMARKIYNKCRRYCGCSESVEKYYYLN